MFHIEIQSPFTSEPEVYANCSADKAIALYQGIDWTDLYRQIEVTGSSAESSFYFYEISRENSFFGEKETLCISGYVRTQVSLRYIRPKMERRGFFVKKDVLNPEFQTVMDDMDQDFAQICFQAFIRGDNSYLEQNMYDKEERSSF